MGWHIAWLGLEWYGIGYWWIEWKANQQVMIFFSQTFCWIRLALVSTIPTIWRRVIKYWSYLNINCSSSPCRLLVVLMSKSCTVMCGAEKNRVFFTNMFTNIFNPIISPSKMTCHSGIFHISWEMLCYFIFWQKNEFNQMIYDWYPKLFPYSVC